LNSADKAEVKQSQSPFILMQDTSQAVVVEDYS